MFSFFSREKDWAHDKRAYIDSVKKHISGNQGGRKGRILSQLCALLPRMFLFFQKDKVIWQHDDSLAELN